MAFTPSVTISGSTLIRDTDDKIQTVLNEATDYINTQVDNAVATTEQAVIDMNSDVNTNLTNLHSAIVADITTIDNKVDSANATANQALTTTDGFQTQLDNLTSGGETTYNTNAIDTKDGNVASASMPYSGYTQVSKKLDNFVFEESSSFLNKVADKNRYVNFGGKVVDTYGEEASGIAPSDGSSTSTVFIDDTSGFSVNDYCFIYENGSFIRSGLISSIVANTYIAFTFDQGNYNRVLGNTYSVRKIQTAQFKVPEVSDIVAETSGVTTVLVSKDNFVIQSRTDNTDHTQTTFRAIQDAPIGTALTNTTYFEDRTEIGVTNQQLAYHAYDTENNSYLGILTETLFSDVSKEDLLDNSVWLARNGFSKVSEYLYSKGSYLVLPVGIWQSLNKGAYHPILNAFGAACWYSSDLTTSSTREWYNGAYLPSALSECFTQGLASLNNRGNISGGVDKRPDSKFYDITYPDQFTDVREYAKILTPYEIKLIKADKYENGVSDKYEFMSSDKKLVVEILGNSTYYPNYLSDLIASGLTPNLELNVTDDNGNSNIPTGTTGSDGKASFKLNNKMTTNHQVLKSTDSGATWSVVTPTVNYIANTITFSTAPLSTDIILVSSTCKNEPLELVDLTDYEIIEEYDYVYASNNHDITLTIPNLINNVTGKISVGTDSVEQLAITKIMNDLVYQTAKTATVDATIRQFICKDTDNNLFAGVRYDVGDTATIDLTDTNVYIAPLGGKAQ